MASAVVPVGPVKFQNYALDECPTGIILRGVLVPETIRNIQIGPYQREQLPGTSLKALKKALKEGGKLPDIELGMRGDNLDEDGGIVTLHDLVYVIDGLQRITAATELMEEGCEKLPHIGASLHFNTTEEWERERFKVLNLDRTRLSPNILMRNWSSDYPVMAMLLQLSRDRNFVLHDLVSWNQRMNRTELMSATTFAKITGRIHAHLVPGLTATQVDRLVISLQRAFDEVGKVNLRENVKTFFNVVDSAYGIRRVKYKEGATYMRGSYLLALARVFSMHEDFWKGNRLTVESSLVRKIGMFEWNDPTVQSLTGQGGKANDHLFMMMVDHINSGKRTRRLTPRVVASYPEVESDDDTSDGEENA